MGPRPALLPVNQGLGPRPALVPVNHCHWPISQPASWGEPAQDLLLHCQNSKIPKFPPHNFASAHPRATGPPPSQPVGGSPPRICSHIAKIPKFQNSRPRILPMPTPEPVHQGIGPSPRASEPWPVAHHPASQLGGARPGSAPTWPTFQNSKIPAPTFCLCPPQNFKIPKFPPQNFAYAHPRATGPPPSQPVGGSPPRICSHIAKIPKFQNSRPRILPMPTPGPLHQGIGPRSFSLSGALPSLGLALLGF
jgi:hypothetical protein